MRTYEDALRSVQRYVFAAMGGKPWRVRSEMDGRFQRPFALVDAPTPSPVQQDGPSAVRISLPITIQLYPVEPEGGSPNFNTEARMQAARAGEVLNQALLFGVPDASDPTVRGHRQRIPLWDYTDDNNVPLPFEGADRVATKREAPDYLNVEDNWTVATRPEASEQQLFVAVINLRVHWYRASMLRAQGPGLESGKIDVVLPIEG